MKLTPELLMPKNVIVQGITGSHGSFHTRAMVAAGTTIIAGTSPTKAGQTIYDLPIFATIKDIQAEFSRKIDATIIFVPAASAKAAIFEAIDAKIPLIVCITEGIPVHDMLLIKQHLKGSGSVLVGPNCPGLLLPGKINLGIIPASLGLPGNVAVVSRSGTLTYEVASGLSTAGVGQKYVIGIGGDSIRGTGFIECLELFENDPDVSDIVLIGEIGGQDEVCAAEYIKTSLQKPVFAYVAGHEAPLGVQLGHAGAIFSSSNESARAKSEALENAGATVFSSVQELIGSFGSR